MKSITKNITIISITLFVAASFVFAQNQGNKNIQISGGKLGDINFKHHMHQAVTKDCQVCHSLFSQTPGALNESIKNGSLKAKQVMYKTCLKCHKALKKDGKPYGPIKCSGCHVK